MNEYLTLTEASELIGKSKETLRRWDREGKLNAVREPMSNYRVYRRDEVQTLFSGFLVQNAIETTSNYVEAEHDYRVLELFAVARVDGCVGLDEVGEVNDLARRVITDRDLTTQPGHDAPCHGLGVGAQRTADGDGRLAHLETCRVRDVRRDQPRRVNLDQGEIVGCGDLDHVRRVLLAALKLHGEGLAVLHHVAVGEDVAVGREDDAGANATGGVAKRREAIC